MDREWLKRLVTDPTAEGVLFVNAALSGSGSLCYGFAAATSNVIIEEDDGCTPYDMAAKRNVTAAKDQWRQRPVRPTDIVEFAADNCKLPLVIVTCDFDQSQQFFQDFCRFSKVGVETLRETGGQELCYTCFPKCREKAHFVSDDGLYLYCQIHARTMLGYGMKLFLYRPTMLTLCINDIRIWLSAVGSDESSFSAQLITFFDLPLRSESMKNGHAVVYDEGALIVRAARDWGGGGGCGTNGPLTTVKAIRYLCARLFAKTELCSPSESMGQPSSLIVNRAKTTNITTTTVAPPTTTTWWLPSSL